MTANRRNTPKAIACAAVVALMGLSMLTACGSSGTQSKGDGALVDTGPNSQLGNNELFSRALANMKALNSFHVEFMENPKDLRWDRTLSSYQANSNNALSSTLTITADIQDAARGSHFKLISADPETLGPDQEASYLKLIVDTGHPTDLLLVENGLYGSSDGGMTWMQYGPGSAGYILLPVIQYVLPFGSPNDPLKAPDYLGYLTKDVAFEDGKPELEKVDGTITRHLVAMLSKPTPGPTENTDDMTSIWAQRVESIDLWISTDAEPKLMQMNIVVSSKTSEFARQQMKLPDGLLYALNWRWGRFNEDLGVIKTPSGSDLVTPSP